MTTKWERREIRGQNPISQLARLAAENKHARIGEDARGMKFNLREWK